MRETSETLKYDYTIRIDLEDKTDFVEFIEKRGLG